MSRAARRKKRRRIRQEAKRVLLKKTIRELAPKRGILLLERLYEIEGQSTKLRTGFNVIPSMQEQTFKEQLAVAVQMPIDFAFPDPPKAKEEDAPLLGHESPRELLDRELDTGSQ